MLWKKSLLISVISTALYGCGAEEQPYDTLSKPSNSFDKSQLKTDQVYLYMPSMGDAPRYAASMAPFFQGKEKLVVLNFEANESHSAGGSLTVREISPDVITQEQLDSGDFGRWIDRPEDTNLVLSIPVDFVDYQCRENDHGECVNKEEHVDSNEVPWQERRFFEPDFANVEVAETTRSVLSRFAESCYITVGSPSLASKGDWKGYEMADDGTINFEVKRTYRLKEDWSCFFSELNKTRRSGFDEGGLTFTASQFYSLVPLDSVRSPSLGEGNDSYEPIVYLKGDENEFGYFTSKIRRSEASYADQQFDQNYKYLNRFNPKLKQIDYHLSDSFDNNEETLFYKRITHEIIESLNHQLAKVGVPLIKLHEPSGKQSGDLRYNVINLIDEPLSNGLSGYGPSAANPLTGEIIHAHVNQYSGVLRAGVSRHWDRIVTDYNNGRIEAIVDPNQDTSLDSTTSLTANVQSIENQSDGHDHDHDHEHDYGHEHNHSFDNDLINAGFTEEESFDAAIAAVQAGLDSAEEEQLTITQLSALNVLEQRLWAENNMYPLEALREGSTFKSLPTEIAGEKFNFDTAVYWKDGLIGQVGQLKTWTELDAKLQERLSLLISGHFYAKTLVHELGHNLGLRHNFQGSNDADNFFKPEELAEYGLVEIPGYSSIMDYAASRLNVLPLFGPYDLAALRFGYKRQIEATTKDETAEDGKVNQFFDISEFDKPLLDALNDPYGTPSELNNGTLLAFAEANKEAGLDITRRIYDYCTDQDVSLNDDCNKFDEGRNRKEIAQHKLEVYNDRYYQLTTRGLKEKFNESTLMAYTRKRIKEFSDWRESLTVFDRYRKTAFSKEYDPTFYMAFPIYYSGIFSDHCGESSPTSFRYESFCGVPLAVDLYRDKLLDILNLPDHTCEITDAEGDISYRNLAEWMDIYALRNHFPVNHVPTSCYDEYVLSTLESGEQVTGEQGVFLNSGKAPRTAPVNNYTGDFDYYGNWPDKLAAAVTLVDRIGGRTSTNRTTLSLFDLPNRYLSKITPGRVIIDRVAEKFLDRLILSTFQRPWNFKNGEGKFHKPTDDFKNFSWDNKIDTMPYYGSYSVRQYFGLPRFGQISLNKAMLNAMVLHLAEQQLDAKDENLARQISVYSQKPDTDNVRSFTRSNEQTYFVTPKNDYAWKMLDYRDDYQALIKAEKAGEDLTKVSLKTLKLKDFQNAKERRLIDDRYSYQKQSLENLPVYNTVATLREDLLTH